jgi:hypothetical protein
MLILKLLLAALSGIIVMTIFSYMVSALARQRFKEPQLLNYLLIRWQMQVFRAKENVAGWIIHYGAGLFFTIIYEFIWQYKLLEVSWAAALFLGVVSGLFGLCVWKVMFVFTPRPPKINFSAYYLQLIPAHILFALGVVGFYKAWG